MSNNEPEKSWAEKLFNGAFSLVNETSSWQQLAIRVSLISFFATLVGLGIFYWRFLDKIADKLFDSFHRVNHPVGILPNSKSEQILLEIKHKMKAQSLIITTVDQVTLFSKIEWASDPDLMKKLQHPVGSSKLALTFNNSPNSSLIAGRPCFWIYSEQLNDELLRKDFQENQLSTLVARPFFGLSKSSGNLGAIYSQKLSKEEVNTACHYLLLGIETVKQFY